eukprot:scaffold160914_cov17-Tisochrysis_lutea.AAC.2
MGRQRTIMQAHKAEKMHFFSSHARVKRGNRHSSRVSDLLRATQYRGPTQQKIQFTFTLTRWLPPRSSSTSLLTGTGWISMFVVGVCRTPVPSMGTHCLLTLPSCTCSQPLGRIVFNVSACTECMRVCGLGVYVCVGRKSHACLHAWEIFWTPPFHSPLPLILTHPTIPSLYPCAAVQGRCAQGEYLHSGHQGPEGVAHLILIPFSRTMRTDATLITHLPRPMMTMHCRPLRTSVHCAPVSY